MDCIFCRIATGEIESNILYQDDQVIAFPDIDPNAPVHLLVVPRKHIESLSDLTAGEEPLMGHMITVANRLVRDEGLSERGYRIVINCGPEGGQLVPHLHPHVLGGRRMGPLG